MLKWRLLVWGFYECYIVDSIIELLVFSDFVVLFGGCIRYIEVFGLDVSWNEFFKICL